MGTGWPRCWPAGPARSSRTDRDDGGIPRPEVNAWVVPGDGEAVQVDFLWRHQRLIVETDGHAYHHTPRAFEADRKRDQRLALAGLRTLRFTRKQIVREPIRVQATVSALAS